MTVRGVKKREVVGCIDSLHEPAHCLVPEVRRSVGYESMSDAKSGGLIDDRTSCVLVRGVPERKDQRVAWMIIINHEYVFFTVRTRSELDMVGLKDVILFRSVHGQSERLRYILPSDCT